jgi:hypothetical protein
MPTQGEAMRMIKSTAEAIMESLRLLLVILMSQLEVRAPDQEIATDHAQVLSNLLNEVQSQKGRIEQLSKMLQGKTLSGSPRRTKSNGSSRNFEIGDQSDASWDLEELEMGSMGLIPTTNMNMNMNQPTAHRLKMPKQSTTAQSSPPRATAAAQGANDVPESQIALTAQALESWGNKRVSWGKTHNGSRFSEVYEQHANYVAWISARSATANVAMQDFIMYAQAREALEHRALRASA